jgi:glycerophosphoryl diester phosphodiesterase
MRDAPSAANGPELIGHRGAPTQLRENTLDGFLLAIDQGADGLELDVHATSDEEIVVYHDYELDGTPIAELLWSEVAAMQADIPRLEDVLDEIGDAATTYIEIKGAGIESLVVEVARSHGKRYAMHSFDHKAIVRVAQLASEIPRGFLIDAGTTNPIQAMRRAAGDTGARDVWPHWSLVGADLMQAARELQLRVIPWTVNSPKSAQHLASLGVAGICTDDVRLLANL